MTRSFSNLPGNNPRNIQAVGNANVVKNRVERKFNSGTSEIPGIGSISSTA